jgi:hypothetical protein
MNIYSPIYESLKTEMGKLRLNESKIKDMTSKQKDDFFKTIKKLEDLSLQIKDDYKFNPFLPDSLKSKLEYEVTQAQGLLDELKNELKNTA